jgi:hypothetical protein
MTTRVIKCIETLGFEVFGSKTPFLHVLDYHNSLGRAITRHSEQKGRAITRHSEQKGTEPVFWSPPTRQGE